MFLGLARSLAVPGFMIGYCANSASGVNWRYHMIALDTWLTKSDVISELNTSGRTVDRLAERKQIQTTYRSVPGRRPLVVYNPDDVARLKEQALTPQPFALPPTSGSVAKIDSGILNPILDVAQQAFRMFQPNERIYDGRTWLTLEEAAKFTGLPKSVLLSAAAAGEIRARKSGRWYFQRRSLEEF